MTTPYQKRDLPALIPKTAVTAEHLSTVSRLLNLIQHNKKLATWKTYQQAFRHWAKECGTDVEDALAQVLLMKRGAANAAFLKWRGEMLAKGLAPATCQIRISALACFIATARMIGLLDWTLELPAIRIKRLRDTRGPEISDVRKILEAVRGQLRNYAMVRLLFDCALRASEVVSLDLRDLEAKQRRLWIMGKGRSEREPITLPAVTLGAILAYVEAERGHKAGPLFVSEYDEDHSLRLEGGRMTYRALWHVVRHAGIVAGVRTMIRPHGLRHAAITQALQVTGGDVVTVQRFSRHTNVQTVLVYNDNRLDKGGEVANLIAIDGAADLKRTREADAGTDAGMDARGD